MRALCQHCYLQFTVRQLLIQGSMTKREGTINSFTAGSIKSPSRVQSMRRINLIQSRRKNFSLYASPADSLQGTLCHPSLAEAKVFLCSDQGQLPEKELTRKGVTIKGIGSLDVNMPKTPSITP